MTTQETLQGIIQQAQAKQIDYDYYTAAYGIAYAIQTARVSGAVADCLNRLERYTLLTAIEIIKDHCATIADVPAFLNARFDFQRNHFVLDAFNPGFEITDAEADAFFAEPLPR